MRTLKFQLYQKIWGVFIIITALAFMLMAGIGWPVGYALAASMAALLFWLQRQRTEDLKLFLRVFETINARQDALEAKLSEICRRPSDQELDIKEREVLDAYFNLCGQAYCHFNEGRISALVWASWRNRMRAYYYNDRVRRRWDKALNQDCHYGFTSQVLK